MIKFYTPRDLESRSFFTSAGLRSVRTGLLRQSVETIAIESNR